MPVALRPLDGYSNDRASSQEGASHTSRRAVRRDPVRDHRLTALFTYFVPIALWIAAYFAGVKVGSDRGEEPMSDSSEKQRKQFYLEKIRAGRKKAGPGAEYYYEMLQKRTVMVFRGSDGALPPFPDQ